ncbi:MAG TPA: choice-of-anchor P family protein [Acidimicrobiales bacterium]|nr:choice-of-anchor P family protein [Acidimicrobiales bacterium]
MILLVLFSGVLAGVASSPASAQVSAVKGSACGYFTNVSLFGGPSSLEGCGQPASAAATSASPSVTLPAGGSATPITAAKPEGATAQYGPATLFSGQYPNATNDPTHNAQAPASGPISVSTVGTTGATGSVTSSASIGQGTQGTTDPNQPRGVGPGPVIADAVASMCSASASGVSASTTITNGVLVTSTTADGSPLNTEPVPANPPANYTRTGVITNVGDSFRAVYNEQTTAADGSITVDAVHVYLLGPTAVGDLVIAQSVCGVTAVAATTTTTAAGATTTTAAGATTTTTVAGATTTTAAAGTTTTTAAAGTTTTTAAGGTTTTTAGSGQLASVSGSACGYIANVSLFGGPKMLRGCGQASDAPATSASPSVTLPAAGSTTPVTATDSDGATAEYGPAKLFSGQYPAGDANAPAPPSGPITVSTQGTTDPSGSVTSSASIGLPRGVGPGPVTADGVSSTCSASSSGATASTTITNGILVTSTNADGIANDTQPVPANPPANYTRTGTITNVGDNFRVVYNEQTTGSDGSITVNAVHLFLLGPTAVGDLVIAQSVCGRGVLTSAGGSGAGTGTVGGSSGSVGLSNTGIEVAKMVGLALLLLFVGVNLSHWVPQPAVAAVRRRLMPWTRRSLIVGRRSGRRRWPK